MILSSLFHINLLFFTQYELLTFVLRCNEVRLYFHRLPGRSIKYFNVFRYIKHLCQKSSKQKRRENEIYAMEISELTLTYYRIESFSDVI